MDFNAIVFWILALATGGCAIALVMTQNIVRAAVWLLFTLCGTAGLFFLLGARGTIAIPNVIGHERDTAAAELRAAGFANPTILGPDPNPMERGKIYRQDPQPGTRLPPDATVTIYWSDGPGSVPVPSLRNRTLAEAKSVLEAVGLKLGSSMDQFDPFVAVGRVISSDPASGISVPQGFTVDVILSRGPQPTPTPAPTPSPTPSPTPTRTLPLP